MRSAATRKYGAPCAPHAAMIGSIHDASTLPVSLRMTIPRDAWPKAWDQIRLSSATGTSPGPKDSTQALIVPARSGAGLIAYRNSSSVVAP